tara:strand:- start:2262 stop:2510 length:249 start_codon:yes stop_codon:yes gene_type:complete
MVDEAMTKNVAYFILIVSFLVMTWFIVNQAKDNRKSAVDGIAPKIAGDDKMSGGAKNPETFDEPDDDALEEMAELLGEDFED